MDPVSSTRVSARVNSSEPAPLPLPPGRNGLLTPPGTTPAPTAEEDEEEPAVAAVAAAAAAFAAAAEEHTKVVHLGHPAPTPSRRIRVEAAPARQPPVPCRGEYIFAIMFGSCCLAHLAWLGWWMPAWWWW